MAVVLSKKPPGQDGQPCGIVDGGIVLKHNPWIGQPCNRYVAFSGEELTPLPRVLTCPACGQAAPLVGPRRAAVRKALAAVHVQGPGDE